MPLIHSGSREAVSENIRREMTAGKPHKQAIAIALDVARRSHKAFGGAQAPWFVRSEARNMVHSGPVLSAVGGRTDHHFTNVKSGAYVMPADVVSHLGQNNSMAGMSVLGKMFSSGPYGSSPGKIAHGRLPSPPRIGHASGGESSGGAHGDHVGQPTPVAIAGGEYVINPELILDWLEKNGLPRDLKLGHQALDKFVLETRKKHIKKLQSLPGPVKG